MSLLALSALGQSSSDQSTTPGSTSSDPNSSSQSSQTIQTPGQSSSQEFFNAKKFMGTSVKDSQGQSLGDIRDVVFNPSGEVFAAFDVSNNRYALVPWQALSITSTGSRGKYQVTLNTSKQALESGPTVPRNQLQQLSDQSFTQSIYAHYNLQAPTPMGGASGKTLGGSSSGVGTSSSIDTNTPSPSTSGSQSK